MSRKTFPIRLEPNFSNEIDWCVFYMKASSKHQYILDAISEKIKRDSASLSEKGIVYTQEGKVSTEG